MAASASAECRTPVAVNDDSLATISETAPILRSLKRDNPALKIFTRASEQYPALRSTFNAALTQHDPLAICRPTDVTQVCAIIKYAADHDIAIACRSGGHDPWGRSRPAGALVIDMRELDTIELSQDRKTITIGGGAIAGNIFKFLKPYGLIATSGGCLDVGYTNWSLIGGYTMFSGSYGMGVDQVLGATLVNAKGQVERPDDETLWGIRGAGGNFGVITSLTVKVHAQPTLLSGIVAWPLDQAPDILPRYTDLLADDFPDEYSGTMAAGSFPGLPPMIFVYFAWGSNDIAAGRTYLDKLAALAPPMMNTVAESTLYDQLAAMPVAYGVNARLRSAHIPAITPAFARLWLAHIARMPSGATCLSTLHFCHGAGARPDPRSCFARRQPHLLVEINGMAPMDLDGAPMREWVDRFFEALKAHPETLKGGYVSLMGLEEEARESYGENWDRLVALKRRKDPKNLFRYAVPEILMPEG